jgi:hypothetical protein
MTIKTLKRRTATLALDLVFPTTFNPPIRTSNKTGDITELAKDLVENGQIERISVVEMPDGTFMAFDGNRRRAASKLAGLTTIEAVVYSPGANDPDDVVRELFVSINDDKRRLANRDMTEIGLLDGPIFNPNVQTTINQLSTLFATGIPQIVKENAGAYVLSVAKRAAYYTRGLDMTTRPGQAWIATTLLWVIRNKQQQKVIAYIRNNFSAKTLRAAIERNKPTPRV